MKVVCIITGTGVGGAEAMLEKVLTRLDHGIRTHVISMVPIGEIGDRMSRAGIPVESLGMRRGIPNPVALLRLAHRLRELAPDVVHTWMYHADLLGGLSARMARVPAVAWCIRHSNLDSTLNNLQVRMIAKTNAALSRWVPDRILCCSKVARRIHAAFGYADDRMVVVPNGFDLAAYRPDLGARDSVRQELGLPPDAPIVGIVGRWHAQKDFATFVAAAGIVHAQRPEVRFAMVGSGVDGANPKLRRLLEATGATSNVYALGLRDDVPRLMAAFDVMVSSSAWGEAFPNVVGESMACGVPCVVTDVGDSAFIVGDTGEVVAPGDVTGMARSTLNLLNMPSDIRAWRSARAMDRVTKEFDIAVVVRQYEAFYQQLADKGRHERFR